MAVFDPQDIIMLCKTTSSRPYEKTIYFHAPPEAEPLIAGYTSRKFNMIA